MEVSVALPILAFLAGGWFALIVRGLVADATHRRMQDAARDALTPEDLAHLKGYLSVVDEHERARVGYATTHAERDEVHRFGT